MIKSMTGYGRVKKLIGTRDITVELRSVNGRYLDASIKLNRIYSPLEEKLRQLLSDKISRGKVELYLSIDNISGDKVELSLNTEYLEGYLKALEKIKSEYGINGEINLQMLAGKQDIFTQKKLDEDMDEIWSDVSLVAEEAIEQFTNMRIKEGENLCRDLTKRVDIISGITAEIKKLAPAAVENHNKKMRERVSQLLDGAEYDEDRLITECALHADRLDVSEELVRLESHLGQFKNILNENAPSGKKLDFLVQEINREINTCGSKANDTEITRLVVDAKCELERIREQIQNIE